jgi:hypothetical protein
VYAAHWIITGKGRGEWEETAGLRDGKGNIMVARRETGKEGICEL